MRKKNGRIFDPLRYNSPKNVLEETYNKAVLECEWYLGDTIQVPLDLWEKVKKVTKEIHWKSQAIKFMGDEDAKFFRTHTRELRDAIKKEGL